MSVTFAPAFNQNKQIPEDQAVWTASLVYHDWENCPEQFKEPELDYKIWQMGRQTLHYWENWANKHNLEIYENYKHFKTFTVGGTFPSPVALCVYGDDPEHLDTDIQLANVNADALLQWLKLPSTGSLHPLKFLRHIEEAKKSGKATEFTRPTVDSDDKDVMPSSLVGDILGAGRNISFGLDENKLHSYLLKLEELCDHCLKYECNISWG